MIIIKEISDIILKVFDKAFLVFEINVVKIVPIIVNPIVINWNVKKVFLVCAINYIYIPIDIMKIQK